MKILGPSTGYTDLLDAATVALLTKERDAGREYQKSPLRPSAAGSCTRELYYQFMQFSGRAKYETELNVPTTHRLLNLGHSVEYHVVRQFELLQPSFEIKYKQQVLSFRKLDAVNDLKLSQWVEGSLDLTFISKDHRGVIDVKSKKDKFSQFYRTNWDETTEKLDRMASVVRISDSESDSPAFWVEDLEAFLDELNDPFFAANFLQLNLYAGNQFLRERGVDHGAIIQYSKNDSRMREVRFKPSEKLYNAVLDKFANVLKAVDEDKEELATRDHTLGSVKCAFCKFKRECWGGRDAKQAYFETFPRRSWPKDTNRLGKVGEAMDVLLDKLATYAEMAKQAKVAEQAVLKLMGEARVNKVRTVKGEVYEAKQLKDSLVIRRGK